jgi:hypothetical protein
MDKDVAKVWAAGGSVFAMLDWSVVEIMLKCVLTLVVIGYTLRKWYLNEQRLKRGQSFETQTIEKE